MTRSSPATRQRPRDRKEQILQAARVLIAERGYRDVSMAQIADRVGITAGALYRHFANKSVLLAAVIERSFDDVTPDFAAGVGLTEGLAAACDLAVRHRDAGVLWWREGRSLQGEDRRELGARLRRINVRFADRIRAERPDLTPVQAEVLAWGVQAILAGTWSYPGGSTDPELVGVLTGVCESVCRTSLSPVPEGPPSVRSRLQPASKRELLLGHAIVLFGERGYHGTALDDIGRAAGVTGPNLYSYFASKADILALAVERGTGALWLLLHSVLRGTDDPAVALRGLVRGYVDLSLDGIVLTSLLQSEPAVLAGDSLARQREYVAEWTALLRAARPALPGSEARLLVGVALSVVNSLVRIDRLRAYPALAADLTAMAVAVLLPD